MIVIINYQITENNTLFGVVSKTRCQPVHIDPCILKFHHCDSTATAEMYLSNLSEFTNLNLSLNNRNLIPIFLNHLPYVFYSLPANNCAVIQIGYKQIKEIKMIEFESKCDDTSLIFCQFLLSPKFENNWIVSVKGNLSGSKWSSNGLLYQMKQSKDSSAMKLTEKELDEHIQSFEQTSSIAVKVATERPQWLDIMLINNKAMPKYKTLQSLYILNQGLNAIPRIIRYGPALFSNLDVSLQLLSNKSKSVSMEDSNMTIEVGAGHRLFPHNATRHSMYFIYSFQISKSQVFTNKCLH